MEAIFSPKRPASLHFVHCSVCVRHLVVLVVLSVGIKPFINEELCLSVWHVCTTTGEQ